MDDALQTARHAFHQHAIEAWVEYSMTGLHLTNDEVIAWLDQLVTGIELPLPACHK